MIPAFVVEITTPKRFILNGLLFGPKKPKRVIVWVHGLGSSMFSKLAIAEKLIDGQTAVLVFNNRGHDTIANVPTTGKKRVKGGAAHEKFTDSADDIQGAINFAKKNGIKNIFLAGHSTGCQKAIYYASRNPFRTRRVLNGVIILAPMSDYSAHRHEYGAKKVQRAVHYAQAMARRGNGQQLLPTHIWDWPWSAQRFLSLYSGKGAEEIFTYWDAKKDPKTLRSVKVPVLVLLAEKDEYGDRPAERIEEWFGKHLQGKNRIEIIPNVSHSFSSKGGSASGGKGGEKRVAAAIRDFMKGK